MIAEKVPTQYDESVRSFSLTLHSLSPRAYNYVRKKFRNNLPHSSTIRKWYANSSCNGEPGLSKESLDTLRKLVEQHEKEIFVTVSFDEMHIKKHVQWSDTKKKFIGHITYGSIPEHAEYLPVANNAIVFMVNGFNLKFNIPVAFHFINCLQSHEKAALIIMALRAVSETGVTVTSLIFDGLMGNFTTCKLLGASFDVDNDFRPFIFNPSNKSKIFILLDAPHMIKLVRNCIGKLKTLYCGDGTKIEWKYFEHLEQLRSRDDVVTHKITKQHILFDRNIMNISLATQLLSESTAKSMEKFVLLPQTKAMFEGCESTIDFTRRFDRLFDVLNSKSDSKGSIFKTTIDEGSKDEIFAYFDESIKYIQELKESREGKNILNCRRKTGFLGFIINMVNMKEIYLTYVQSKKMNILATRRLNQDPLENFYGRIRTTCLGNNDNPTVEQFCSAYRKIIVSTELTCSTFSNCVDQLNILHIPSTNVSRKPSLEPVIVRVPDNSESQKTLKSNVAAIESVAEVLNSSKPPVNDDSPNPFIGSEITISYLAGLIEKKFSNQIRTKCSNCCVLMVNIFSENSKNADFHVQTEVGQIPCQSTIDICRITNECLHHNAYKIDFSYNNLLRNIEENLEEFNLYESTDFSHDFQHKIDLVRIIVEEFLRIRATYIAKKITLNEKKKLLRRKNLKDTHYAGE